VRMALHRWKAGDSHPIQAALTIGGRPVPLGGATITFLVRPRTGEAGVELPCVALDFTKAIVEHEAPVLFGTPGLYYSEYRVFGPGGDRITMPNGNEGFEADFYDTWEVLASLVP
jgi:hypothetical protein